MPRNQVEKCLGWQVLVEHGKTAACVRGRRRQGVRRRPPSKEKHFAIGVNAPNRSRELDPVHSGKDHIGEEKVRRRQQCRFHRAFSIIGSGCGKSLPCKDSCYGVGDDRLVIYNQNPRAFFGALFGESRLLLACRHTGGTARSFHKRFSRPQSTRLQLLFQILRGLLRFLRKIGLRSENKLLLIALWSRQSRRRDCAVLASVQFLLRWVIFARAIRFDGFGHTSSGSHHPSH